LSTAFHHDDKLMMTMTVKMATIVMLLL